MFRARGGSTGVNGAGTRRARRFASLLLLVGLLWLGSRASTADNLRRSSEGEYASQIYRGVAEGARAFIHHDAHRARDRGPYERPSILLLGDSLVQRGYEPGGWVSRLANEYARTADVVLRGYAGYNTRWIRQLMTDRPGLFPDPKHVALVIVLLVRSHPFPSRVREFASRSPRACLESSRIHLTPRSSDPTIPRPCSRLRRAPTTPHVQKDTSRTTPSPRRSTRQICDGSWSGTRSGRRRRRRLVCTRRQSTRMSAGGEPWTSRACRRLCWIVRRGTRRRTRWWRVRLGERRGARGGSARGVCESGRIGKGGCSPTGYT